MGRRCSVVCAWAVVTVGHPPGRKNAMDPAARHLDVPDLKARWVVRIKLFVPKRSSSTQASKGNAFVSGCIMCPTTSAAVDAACCSAVDDKGFLEHKVYKTYTLPLSTGLRCMCTRRDVAIPALVVLGTSSFASPAVAGRPALCFNYFCCHLGKIAAS